MTKLRADRIREKIADIQFKICCCPPVYRNLKVNIDDSILLHVVYTSLKPGLSLENIIH